MMPAGSTSGHLARGIALRLIITAVAIGAWFLTQAMISKRPFPASGIGDGMHLLTAPLHHYFLLHPTAANALLIVSSGVIDLLAIFVLAEWVFGASVRPLLGMVMLFALRQVMEGLCALPEPEGMIWHNPGFPSLLVTYNVANDYFFSGHTAVAVFAATELGRLERRALKLLAVILVLFEVTTVLVLRAHYTMDVFAGIIAALYVARLCERLSPPLDRKLEKLVGPAT
jgi:hypothetical protein